jgi:EAL domain-containing protein (putative c-di-GMP-specific phosphodiesterase class I)/GGDEF domain-containing protein
MNGDAGAYPTDSERDARSGLATDDALRAWLAGDAPGRALILFEAGNLALIEAGAGRALGDRLLALMAERLATFGGTGRLLARSGVHELAVAIAGADVEMIEAIADRAIADLSAPLFHDGREWHLAVRGGGAVEREGEGGAGLRRRATAALGWARQSGLRRFAIAPPGSAAGMLDDGGLEADFAGALAGEGLRILFQPQFAVADGRLVGAEALARWDHPRFGRLGAEALFAAAERMDMVDRLSETVQDRALAIAARWPAALGRLRLSLNLVSQQVGPGDAAERIAGLVAAHGFAAERLTVEITETGLMDNLDHVAPALAALRKRGIAVAIDDFGTGHSSLAYLHRLPIDAVKIDRRLTRYLGVRGRDGVIVEAVLALARALGLKSVAEGIETPDQLAALQAMQGDAWQGFLRSEPLEAAALEAFAGA